MLYFDLAIEKFIATLCPVAAAQIPFHPRGRVAQLAEHSALNRQVEGSIPSASTIKSGIYGYPKSRLRRIAFGL